MAPSKPRFLTSHSVLKMPKNIGSSLPTAIKRRPSHSNASSSRPSINVFLSPHNPSILIASPADAEPYATILSIHPRFEIDQREGVLKTPIHLPPSSLVDASLTVEKQDHEPDRKEPDLPVYSDSCS